MNGVVKVESSLGVHEAVTRDDDMADDDGVDVVNDGDDNQCDTLPPAKKYEQSRLSFSISASVDRANHE